MSTYFDALLRGPVAASRGEEGKGRLGVPEVAPGRSWGGIGAPWHWRVCVERACPALRSPQWVLTAPFLRNVPRSQRRTETGKPVFPRPGGLLAEPKTFPVPVGHAVAELGGIEKRNNSANNGGEKKMSAPTETKIALDAYVSLVDAILGPGFESSRLVLSSVDTVIAAFHAQISPFGCAMLLAAKECLVPA